MNVAATEAGITILPATVPGTRLIFVTDPYLLLSTAGYHTRALTSLMRQTAIEVDNENGLHIALAIPGLSFAEILPRVLRAAQHYTRMVGNAHPDIEIRKVTIQWFSVDALSETMSTVEHGSCTLGTGERELKISVITPEYLAHQREAASYVLHACILGTAARLEGNPYDQRETWPADDYHTALTAWQHNAPADSDVVSVAWYENPSRRLYVNQRNAA